MAPKFLRLIKKKKKKKYVRVILTVRVKLMSYVGDISKIFAYFPLFAETCICTRVSFFFVNKERNERERKRGREGPKKNEWGWAMKFIYFSVLEFFLVPTVRFLIYERP